MTRFPRFFPPVAFAILLSTVDQVCSHSHGIRRASAVQPPERVWLTEVRSIICIHVKIMFTNLTLFSVDVHGRNPLTMANGETVPLVRF